MKENEKNNTQEEQKNIQKAPLPKEPEKPKIRSMLESDFPKEPEKPKVKTDLEEYSISIAKIRKALEE